MHTDPRRHRLLTAAAVLALGAVAGACGGDSAGGPAARAEAEEVPVTGPTIPPDAESILTASAAAMGEVTSVRFDLVPSGAPVYIDTFESIAVRDVAGQVEVDEAAAAVLGVQVDGSLNTELAAVAVGSEVLLTNPITGKYEPLPPGIELDPSLFFDPQDGWRPLLAGLVDAELVGLESRGGDRYHVRGTAPAERIEVITARLVRGQELVIDFWIHPATALVTAAEFTATFPAGDVTWTLELGEYGRDFDIAVPDELRGDR